jgi:DNA-3-methyladenine glycosylase II
MGEIDRIVPRGPFSVEAAAEFGFGPNEGRPPRFDGTMRLAFPCDGGAGYAGAALSQPGGPDGPVEVTLQLRGETGEEARAAALSQVARIVSLDYDGDAFSAVGERDAVIGALQHAHPGQRPVLFPSPYEAAAWSVLSARRPAHDGARVRLALGAELGETFELAGEQHPAFPVPERLAEIPDGFPGLNATKIERLRGVAAAALAGELEVARIHELGPEAAYEHVQRISGIGPFYATLIVLRASGFADAWLGSATARTDTAMRDYYGDGVTDAVADGWRPFRTWALVLVRLAGYRGTRI